jgi:hypothetical protein
MEVDTKIPELRDAPEFIRLCDCDPMSGGDAA